jgi:cation:H+ antiporter
MFNDALGFITCATIIVICGTYLSRLADKIAELTGLGRAWLGLVLLASITSLPELISGASSILIVKSPDLAAGTIFGSCAFNLFILSVIDMLVHKPLTSIVKTDHLLAGLLGIMLLVLSAVAIITSGNFSGEIPLSPFSVLIVLVYLFGFSAMHKYGNRENGQTRKITIAQTKELQKTILFLVINAVIVVAASLFLPFFGERVADSFNLGKTFFGTLFLASVTSLPEFVVSLAAIRIKAYDLSVGNLVGSNIFNLIILAFDDIFYDGNFYGAISSSHLLSICATILMTSVIGINLLVKFEKKFWRFSADAITIMGIFIILIMYLYKTG